MTRRAKSFVHWHEFPGEQPDLPPVLFLHGFLGSGLDWREVAEGCADSFHCLCPDLPGHGQAECPVGASFETVAEALAAGVRERGISRCGLVGYSMGGRLALYLALEHPELFDRLALESASPGIADEEDRATRRETDAGIAARLESVGEGTAEFSAFLEGWYAQPIFSTITRDHALLERVVARRMNNGPARLAQALRALGIGAQPSLWERLPAFQTPTLLLVGAEDHKFRIIAEEMSERAPRMALEAFAECSHNVHLENPAGYTTALKSFLLAAR